MAIQASPCQYDNRPHPAAGTMPLPTPPRPAAASHSLGGIAYLQQHQQQQQLPMLSSVFPFNVGVTATGYAGSGRKRARDQQYAPAPGAGSEIHTLDSQMMSHKLHLQKQHGAPVVMQNQPLLFLPPPSVPPPPSQPAAADGGRSDGSAAAASTSGRQDGTHGLFFIDPTPSAAANAKATAPLLHEACLLSDLPRHGLDVAALIHRHDENLRMALHAIHRRQSHAILAALERRIQLRLEAKQQELHAALFRHAELEAQLRQAEAESRAWSTAAKKGEAMVEELYSELNKALIPKAASGSCAEEGSGGIPNASAEESRCGGVPEAAAADEKARDHRGKTASASTMKAICRVCLGGSEASVVLLPCRHLCVCAACEAAAEGELLACPVCGVHRNGSLHIASHCDGADAERPMSTFTAPIYSPSLPRC